MIDDVAILWKTSYDYNNMQEWLHTWDDNVSGCYAGIMQTNKQGSECLTAHKSGRTLWYPSLCVLILAPIEARLNQLWTPAYMRANITPVQVRFHN
jgi:hypothetical protein